MRLLRMIADRFFGYVLGSIHGLKVIGRRGSGDIISIASQRMESLKISKF